MADDSRNIPKPDGTPRETLAATGNKDTDELARTVAADSQPAAVEVGDTAIVATSFAERYQPRELLGAGGMGQVRLMTDRIIGRDVAMKELRSDAPASTLQARSRFVWEARVQAQLEHPAIVPVYDMGLTGDEREFFTMKCIAGKTLADVVASLKAGDEGAQREYPRNRLLASFRQVCLAVEYAHQRGVIHRDLKLANLMLGDFGEVYVLDWGLSKVTGQADDLEPTAEQASLSHQPAGRTVQGSLLGTPGYMSPEQATGEQLDARTDVYSLGVVLFELLSHEQLHAGESIEALIASTLRPTRAEHRLLDRDLPPELARLCGQATRVERDERLASAGALAEGVQQFLDGDRDAELRARLAEHHAGEAEAAARNALASHGDPLRDRQRALREAGRALALDPSSARAASALMSILLEPPPELPGEVVEAVSREECEEARATARQGAPTYFINAFIALAVGLVFGIESPTWLAAIMLPQFVAAALCLFVTRQRYVSHALILGIATASFAAIAADAGIAGPLILVPGYAAANLILLSVSTMRPHRHALLVLACLSVAVPVALEYTPWVAPAYEFLDTGIRVNPRAVGLPPLALPLGALAAIATALIGPAVVGWRIRDVLAEMRRRVHLQSWMLRQLAPDARASSATTGDDASAATG